MTRDHSAPLTREDPAPLAWWWNASLIALGLAMALFRLIPTEADPDLWGHLRFGIDTVAAGRIVHTDIYSYLSGDQPWINHEWLAEAITAIAWTTASGAGIVIVKVALGLALAVVVCRHLTRRDVPLLGALLMTAYGMAVILPGLRSLRPQAFTYLAFALLLICVHRASRGRVAWLALAPPLMAVWANLHGGFVAGLGVLGVWVVADTIRLRARPSGALVIAATSAAATLVTPYTWTLWTFLARTLGPRPEIAEWQGVSLVTIQGLAYLAVAGAGVTGLFLTRRERPPIDVMLIACAVLLPFIAQRHLPLTVLIVLVIGGEHIASAAPVVVRRLTLGLSTAPDRAADTAHRGAGAAGAAHARSASASTARDTSADGTTSLQSRGPRLGLVGESDISLEFGPSGSTPRQVWSDRFRPLVAAALLVEASVLLVLIARSPTTGQITYSSAEYPVEAVARLADLAAERGRANVAVHFNWGEYVLWHAGPRVKVSMDGRRETVYSDAAYHDNSLFIDGVGEWDRLLARRPRASRGETELALVPAGTAVYHLLSLHPDWELVMERGPAALFGRRGSPVTSHVRAIPARAPGEDTTLIFP
jgi:hypothetical protein